MRKLLIITIIIGLIITCIMYFTDVFSREYTYIRFTNGTEYRHAKVFWDNDSHSVRVNGQWYDTSVLDSISK